MTKESICIRIWGQNKLLLQQFTKNIQSHDMRRNKKENPCFSYTLQMSILIMTCEPLKARIKCFKAMEQGKPQIDSGARSAR